MAISAANLTYPPGGTGEIRPEWFPGEALADVLAVWIAQGYSRAADEGVGEAAAEDRVAIAHAYREAYRAIAARLAGTPDSVSLEDLSRTTSNGRVKFFADRALAWDLELSAAIAAGQPAPEPAVSSPPLASRAMQNDFVF
jgi:hypothetical protein